MLRRGPAALLAALLLPAVAGAGGYKTREGLACDTLSRYIEATEAAIARDDRGFDYAMAHGCQTMDAGLPASILARGEHSDPRWVRVRVYREERLEEVYMHPRSIDTVREDGDGDGEQGVAE